MRRLAPLLCLLAYGGAFAVRAFGGGVPAFDDHPGQLFRLWHLLERSIPDGRWTADWNPDWWGGYAELQFYPPGFALAGAGLRLLALWQPSVDAVYQLLCGLALLLPALATYALLVTVTGDGWLALPPAFLALTLSAGLRGGVEESLRWGMLTSRLALGLLPLLALSLRSWLETGRRPRWAPAAAAAVVLAHPASAPVAAAMLALATFLAAALRPRRTTLLDAAATGAIALGLVAFWALPLVVRREWVVPLTWGHRGLDGLLAEVAARPLLLVLGLAALLAWIPVAARRRPFDAFLAALPVVLGALLLADGLLFRSGWSSIEPDRLLDAVAWAALAAAGLGLGAVTGARTARGHAGARPVLAAVLIAVAVLLAARGPSEPTLTLWPRERARLWPHLDEVERAHDLPALWRVLRGGADRVLFLTSALRLDDDPAWYAPHSHVPSLAPVYTGREIVHGTFTHPAPLAARFYTGAADVPRRVETLVEELDGRRLLGHPWDRLPPASFEAFVRRLRIATVVVPTADVARARRFLADRYRRAHAVGGLTVFERRDRPWPEIERITHRRYRVYVSPTGGVWVPTGIPAYPLWQAKSGQGRLETREDAWGLLEFRVPLDVFEAELVYAEGALEWTGVVLTLLSLAGWAAWARPGPARAATRAVRRTLARA